MTAFYIRRIKTGKNTLSTVPKKWRQDVKDELDRELEAGEITQEEYDIYIQ